MAIENTEEIKLKKGESTEITLKGLATAGYRWDYEVQENKTNVTITKDFVSSGNLAQKTMGASADEVFTITANEKGVVPVTFFQKRSWEKNADPVNIKKVNLIID